jgi:xylulokinase
MSVAAQQHGCVPLGAGADRPVLAPASLWCDTSSAPEAERLNALADFAAEVGSRLVASFTITKLMGMPPETTAVCLPHDWLTWRLTGAFATDRGDASGTGWWDDRVGLRRDLLRLSGRPELVLPEVLGPDEPAGSLLPAAAAELGLAPGVHVGPGTGDNMAAALGIGAREGEVVVSLGTSGTVFAVSAAPTRDASGLVAGFADATGRFLPLACTLNCTVPVDIVAGWFGIGVEEALTRADRPSSVTFLPYLNGERTPDLPAATGAIIGLSEETTPDDLLAAAVQGSAASLALGVIALREAGVPAPDSVLVVGGGSRHPTWVAAVADATGRPASCPDGEDHAARGAAAQARAVLDRASVREVAEAWRPPAGPRVLPREGMTPPLSHDAFRDAIKPLWSRR